MILFYLNDHWLSHQKTCRILIKTLRNIFFLCSFSSLIFRWSPPWIQASTFLLVRSINSLCQYNTIHRTLPCHAIYRTMPYTTLYTVPCLAMLYTVPCTVPSINGPHQTFKPHIFVHELWVQYDTYCIVPLRIVTVRYIYRQCQTTRCNEGTEIDWSSH